MNKRLVFLIILVISLVTGFLFYRNIGALRLQTGLPKTIEPGSSLVLIFNQDVASSPEELSKNYSLEPYALGEFKVEGKKVTLNPSVFLKNGVTYKLKIDNIRSKNGKQISISQETRVVATTESPKEKFARSLPYFGAGFMLDYIKTRDEFVVDVYGPVTKDIKDEVADVMTDWLLDPKKETIVYTSARSTSRDGGGAPPL